MKTPVRIPSRFQGPARHRWGFTFVELLVVIAIILMLIALVMPALERAQRTVNVAVCAHNLRQIHLAFMAYVSDNDGRFPKHGVDWGPKLMPYLGGSPNASVKVYKCPAHACPQKASVGGYTQSYSIYVLFETWDNTNYVRYITDVPRPAETGYLTELAQQRLGQTMDAPLNAGTGGTGYDISWQIDPNSVGVQKSWVDANNVTLTLHDGRVNLLYVDGHVEHVPLDDTPNSRLSQNFTVLRSLPQIVPN